ncbi:uncharacterized protein N7459_007622 [Penicillium hispanicum]|uniref:uncharacterized protein n=1 Tax=Penicillium hispanicum TaxID=1080232 RepID=UPI002541DD0B|nr:uncharacterized protein N7459_007622 [Penicillium hispanicum]KAJ5578658.1 hypothetical protein N7459_007622 [Penicillium hispanicum]
MTSILGQGLNQAIETVAALANSLTAKLADPATAGPLALHELHAAFQQTYDVRAATVSAVAQASHNRNRMDAMVTPEMEEFMLVKFPSAFPGIILKRWDDAYAPAVSLNMLELPYRPKEFTYLDEAAREAAEGARGARL